MADSDFRDQSPFIARAREVFEAMGERMMFPGVNPAVKRYTREARKGHYTTPEDVEAALVDMEWDILEDYFPEEFARREAIEIAEARKLKTIAHQKAMAENPGDYDSEGNMLEDVVANRLRGKPLLPQHQARKNITEMPEEYRKGGRVRLI